MNVLFIASVAVVTPEPATSRALFVDALARTTSSSFSGSRPWRLRMRRSTVCSRQVYSTALRISMGRTSSKKQPTDGSLAGLAIVFPRDGITHGWRAGDPAVTSSVARR